MGTSTLMVAVLCAQQLFGAYHVFSAHLNDRSTEVSDNQTQVSDIDVQCDFCAKLNSGAALLDFGENLASPALLFFIVLISGEKTFPSNRFKAVFQRGPPTFS